jgi:hypothetical protein
MLDFTLETPVASTVPEPFGTPAGPGLWKVKMLELPAYIQHIAHALLRGGRAADESQAIQMAVGIVKKWAAGIPTGGGATHKHVHPDVQAAAAKAVAEWEAKRAIAHASHNHSRTGGSMDTVDLAFSGPALSLMQVGNPGPDSKKIPPRVMSLGDLARAHVDSTTALGASDPQTLELGAQLAAMCAGQAAKRTALVKHLGTVHQDPTWQAAGQTVGQLQAAHVTDHANHPELTHGHGPGLGLKQPKEGSMGLSQPYGTQMRFNVRGERIDLATAAPPKAAAKGKASDHPGFKKLVKRIIAQGKTPEEANAIAASIGIKKYGAKKFQAMADAGAAATKSGGK